MKRIILSFLVVLFLPSGIKADEPFYSNTWMGIDYELFINDKESFENEYIYRFRTRVETNSRTTINEWSIADCLESRINGVLVPAIKDTDMKEGCQS